MESSEASIGSWNAPALATDTDIAVTPPPTRQLSPMARLRLATMSDLAKEHRKLYREARGGVISASEATKLAYLLSTLASLMTATEIEDRLGALERRG